MTTDVSAPTPDPACADRHLGGCRGRLVTYARFGLPGEGCKVHYNRRNCAAIRAERVAHGAVPCWACGTTAGFVRPNSARPVRFRAKRDGREVSLCHECRWAPAPMPALSALPDAHAVGDPPVGVGRLPPDLATIRLRAFALLSRTARRGDWIEDRRLARMERGPRWRMSPAEGARRAIAEYGNTIFGGGARP